MNEPLYYTPEEIAAALRVSEETIRRQLREGQIKGQKVGRMWRIPRDEAIKLLGSEAALKAIVGAA
jgi:excisionase family DNA binding protein